MATLITPNVPKASAPDLIADFLPRDAIPNALIMSMAVHAGDVEGDSPAVRVPYVSQDLSAAIVAEGAEIPESNLGLSEIVLTTKKAASLATFSREMLEQPNAARIVADSMNRAVVAQADGAFISELLKGTKAAAPTGVDPFIDAMLAIEAAGGKATHILVAPDVLGTLLKVKTAEGSAVSLIGGDGTAAPRRVLLGIELRAHALLAAGTAVMLDKNAVVSAHGPVLLSKSEHSKFASDSVQVRETFRFGAAVADADRVKVLAA